MKLAILAITALLSGAVQAAEPFCESGKPHAIDLWLETALEDAKSTVEIRDAQSKAYGRWDNEMNSAYRALMGKLREADREKLKSAQRAWLKWYDAEFQWLWSPALEGINGGTIGPVQVSDLGREAVKRRTCELLRYSEQVEY
jgi:uncharacterized protein YecT (DUF1311 family)